MINKIADQYAILSPTRKLGFSFMCNKKPPFFRRWVKHFLSVGLDCLKLAGVQRYKT